MLVEWREREQQPAARGQNEDQEYGRKDGVAETPRHHPVRRDTAGPRQNYAVNARKRKEPRESYDDRLDAHNDDHKSKHDLIDHADTDRDDEDAERGRNQSDAIQRNDRDIDEREQRSD